MPSPYKQVILSEVDINWQIFAAAFGFAGARALLDEYRMWKTRRTEIPLDWNAKAGVYEPDLKLRKWERRAKIAFWGLFFGHLAFGYLMVVNYPIPPDMAAKLHRSSHPTGSD